MPSSPAKEETKQEREDREARERLENPDMGLFDRFMRRLIDLPKEKTKPPPPKRGHLS
jgi:hypothetical protein